MSALFPFIPTIGKGENCDPTTSDIEGPFYTPNAPVTNKISPEGAAGTVLFLTGTVYHNDCQTPIANANLDVWQANDAGAYDNVGFNFRGKFDADEMGNYSMETILPGKYLNGNSYRPRHIHMKIGTAGNVLLTTQLYFEGDTDIAGDQWASDESAENRIIPLSEDVDGNLHGVFDISLDVTPVINATNSISSPGIGRIISINPNPIESSGTIKVAQSQRGDLALNIMSLNGRLVKSLSHSNIPAGSHAFDLDNLNRDGIKLTSGIYVLQLLVDQQLTDAKRFIVI